MGKIITTVYEEKNLTVLKVFGTITHEEVLEFAGKAAGGNLSTYVLWDFEHGDATGLSPQRIRGHNPSLKSYSEKRKGGKTAFVFFRDVDFGFGRMIESYLELNRYPVNVKSFRSMEAAFAWLGVEPPIEAEQ